MRKTNFSIFYGLAIFFEPHPHRAERVTEPSGYRETRNPQKKDSVTSVNILTEPVPKLRRKATQKNKTDFFPIMPSKRFFLVRIKPFKTRPNQLPNQPDRSISFSSLLLLLLLLLFLLLSIFLINHEACYRISYHRLCRSLFP